MSQIVDVRVLRSAAMVAVKEAGVSLRAGGVRFARWDRNIEPALETRIQSLAL